MLHIKLFELIYLVLVRAVIEVGRGNPPRGVLCIPLAGLPGSAQDNPAYCSPSLAQILHTGKVQGKLEKRRLS